MTLLPHRPHSERSRGTPARRATVAVMLAIGGLAFTAFAQAGVVQYTVEGTFDSGNLTGRSYLESFTFDDASKPATLGLIPWETPLLSYSLEVEGIAKHWTVADWPLEHTFAQWVDGSGYLNSLATLETPGPAGQQLAVSTYYDDGAPHSRSKTVKWNEWSVWNVLQTNSSDTNPLVSVMASPVPEPSTAAMLLLGLVGLAAGRRRSRRG